MNRNYSPTASGWAIVLLSAAVLALGGCGRKGTLDLPPTASAEALRVLSVEASVKSRTSYGGTAPKNVEAQAKAWLKRLEKERKLG